MTIQALCTCGKHRFNTLTKSQTEFLNDCLKLLKERGEKDGGNKPTKSTKIHKK